MTVERDDRRVQRTRVLLQRALISIVAEKRFDKITVQEIIDHANVGRTTFYAHFESKADLFLSSHDGIISLISQSFYSPENREWCSEPSAELITFFERMQESGDMHFYLTWGGEVHRLLQVRIAKNLDAFLNEHFDEDNSAVPFDVLSEHLSASMVALMNWWMDKKTPYSPAEIARMLHQMNLAVLRSAIKMP